MATVASAAAGAALGVLAVALLRGLAPPSRGDMARTVASVAAGAALGVLAVALLRGQAGGESPPGPGGGSREEDAEEPAAPLVGSRRRPLCVVVSGAAGRVARGLLPLLASGAVFGARRALRLHLLELPAASEALAAVRADLEEAAFPLLAGGVLATSDAEEALRGADVAVLLGGGPLRGSGAEGHAKSWGAFAALGRALERVADPEIRILVVADPCCTNCLVLQRHAPKVPPAHFSVLSGLDANRAAALLAAKVNCAVDSVSNLSVWGNPSSALFVCADNAHVVRNNVRYSARQACGDDARWLLELGAAVRRRASQTVGARKEAGAISTAKAIGEHLTTWLVTGTRPGETTSMGIYTEPGNAYEIRAGLFFSFPVHVRGGRVSIDTSYRLGTAAMESVRQSEAELFWEGRDAAASLATEFG
jgi:malate dehydrogenase